MNILTYDYLDAVWQILDADMWNYFRFDVVEHGFKDQELEPHQIECVLRSVRNCEQSLLEMLIEARVKNALEPAIYNKILPALREE